MFLYTIYYIQFLIYHYSYPIYYIQFHILPMYLHYIPLLHPHHASNPSIKIFNRTPTRPPPTPRARPATHFFIYHRYPHYALPSLPNPDTELASNLHHQPQALDPRHDTSQPLHTISTFDTDLYTKLSLFKKHLF